MVNLTKDIQQFFSYILTPPTVADPTQAHTARLLHYLLLLGVPIAFSFVIFDTEVRAGIPGWGDMIAGCAGIVMVVLIVLLRYGYVQLATILMIFNALGAIGLAGFNNLGIRNPAIMVIPLLLMLCSLLLSSRVTTLFAIGIGGMATWLYLMEQKQGFYPQPTRIDSDYLLIVLITIAMTTLILHFTLRQIVQSAQRIRQQADELHLQNQRLAQIQIALEERTQQLSKLNAELQLEMNERARTEATLRQKQKLESVGLLAGGVAHDFNNLLTSILNQSDLALRRLNNEQKARQHIEKAIHSTQRAADLTRQLLAYAGKARFQIELVDVNQLIYDNHNLLVTALQHNAALQLVLLPELPAIAADRGQLQQVLMNLVINAFEAIVHDHGQITITTSTVAFTTAVDPITFVGAPPSAGNYVCLEVSDNGNGMEQSLLEKIFDPFFSTKKQGHGLGLSVVLGVVQALHGGLQVQSRPAQGSTFRVYLPASTQKLPANQPTALLALQQQYDQLVLVIDDEEPVRDAVVEMLNTIGYRTIVAPNGLEGLAILGQRQAEIGTVLLDIVMPGISGLETFQKIRILDDTIKVILSSGYSDSSLPDTVLLHPTTAFLAKPYTLEQLHKTMVTVGQSYYRQSANLS